MTGHKAAQEREIEDFSVDRAYVTLEVLPDVGSTFVSATKTLEEVLKSGNIIIDANVLLIPYGAGAHSLSKTTEVYKKLGDDGRLFIPAQAMREFLKNRPVKIADLYQSLSDRISKVSSLEKLSYPILSAVDEFNQINAHIDELDALKKKINKAKNSLLQKIRGWESNDPVIEAYRSVISKGSICEPKFDKEALLRELRRRYDLRIPPGYKDSSKDDYGVGDFLIWKTILDIGKKTKKDAIFVSGDEKADWQHRSGGVGLLPRYELLDEYRTVSGGHFFYMVPLSRLLELSNVEPASVDEIRQEEARQAEANTVSVTCPYCSSEFRCRLEEHIGSSALPTCPSCASRFHIHRTRYEITVHKPGERIEEPKQFEEVKVTCPACDDVGIVKLGVHVGSTAWNVCDNCSHKFPIHRRSDSSVFVRPLSSDHDS